MHRTTSSFPSKLTTMKSFINNTTVPLEEEKTGQQKKKSYIKICYCVLFHSVNHVLPYLETILWI